MEKTGSDKNVFGNMALGGGVLRKECGGWHELCHGCHIGVWSLHWGVVGALIDASLIPTRFRSFLRIPVPFKWNPPAKISKYQYFGTYTGTVPGMDRNRMALECMTGMDAKNYQIWQGWHFHMKNSNKIGEKNRDGAHYW